MDRRIKGNIVTIIESMAKQSPPHHFEFSDPFWVLITTILSHRTKDSVTDKAARKLYERYHDCKGLSKAKYDDVLGIIDKVGFKREKAKRVIDAAEIICTKYSGKVPESIDELMSIRGIGRKTANVILSDALGIPAIAVDTHVQRICRRIGIAKNDNPFDTEKALMGIVPKNMWIGLNPMMVEFGKNICRPIGPKCHICSVREFCRYGQKRLNETAKK